MMKTSPKTWKKILIAAWALFGLSLAIFATIALCKYIKENTTQRWYQYTISDDVQLHRNYEREQMRFYNTRLQRYVSPKMRWYSDVVSEGDSFVVFCDLKNKRGYLNINTGEMVIAPQFDYAWNFSNGLAAVCRNLKIGFVNPAGEEVILCQYPTTNRLIDRLGYAFYNGYCTVTNSKSECGLIDTNGVLVVDTIYDCIWNPCKAGVRIVQDEGKYGVMDLTGKIIVPLEYDDVWCDGFRLFAVKNGIMSQLDNAGNVVQPFCSSYGFESFYNGYFKYHVKDKEGIIDSKGNVLIPAIYHRVNEIDENLFEVQYDQDYSGEGGAWITIRL